MPDRREGVARSYRAPRREEQARRTRRRILEAGRAQFLAAGFAGATMRRIAEAAGVSLPSVEQAFGTKARLLAQVVDVAIAGDDEPVPVLERAPAARAAAAERVEDFLLLVADLLTEGQQRSARLVLVVFEAAGADPGVRLLAQDRLAQRARTAEWIVDGMLRRGRPRPGVDRAHAVDTVWLLMDPAVFCRLTEDRGWSAVRYRDWFADSAARLLLGADEPS
jgi:AcrR family transcriptional regulator